MVLCLDIGNSQIYGGVFNKDELMFQFRRSTKTASSSDEIGVFLRSVLRENDIQHDEIKQIAVCTVVPEVLHSLKNACRKYFNNMTPFILQAGVRTGLNIKYRNPLELGSDRIANAIAATYLYPNRNLIIIDMGTAITFCAVNGKNEFLGGSILPGLKIAMSALENNTSKLPAVEIVVPENVLARSTVEGIQSGLYFGTLGAAKEIIHRLNQEAFNGEKALVIGTGGFASLFENANLFDVEIPDLVLKGLYLSLAVNNLISNKFQVIKPSINSKNNGEIYGS
jgi:type III pantothenate kinase